MSEELVFFESQIASLSNLSLVFEYLNKHAPDMDIDALLRSEYVLIVSAFDNYMHKIVRRKLREGFFNNKELTKAVSLPITIVQLLMNQDSEDEQQGIFDSSLRKVFEKDAFQSPKSVEYALGLLGLKQPWRTFSGIIGDTPDHIKNTLALIIQRRNQIAHEADIDYSGLPRAIDLITVSDCRDFFSKLVSSIDSQI